VAHLVLGLLDHAVGLDAGLGRPRRGRRPRRGLLVAGRLLRDRRERLVHRHLAAPLSVSNLLCDVGTTHVEELLDAGKSTLVEVLLDSEVQLGVVELLGGVAQLDFAGQLRVGDLLGGVAPLVVVVLPGVAELLRGVAVPLVVSGDVGARRADTDEHQVLVVHLDLVDLPGGVQQLGGVDHAGVVEPLVGDEHLPCVAPLGLVDLFGDVDLPGEVQLLRVEALLLSFELFDLHPRGVGGSDVAGTLIL